MFTRIPCFLFALFLAAPALAQSGAIEGRIIDETTGEALPGVNVGIIGTSAGAAADGYFSIDDLSPGRYTLRATSIGYEPAERNVRVTAEDVATANFTLTRDDIMLQKVEIVGRRATSYKSNYSFVATKGATPIIETPIIETPQAISVVTKELIDDLQLYELGDVAAYVSGLNLFSGYNDLTIRGFRMSRHAFPKAPLGVWLFIGGFVVVTLLVILGWFILLLRASLRTRQRQHPPPTAARPGAPARPLDQSAHTSSLGMNRRRSGALRRGCNEPLIS